MSKSKDHTERPSFAGIVIYTFIAVVATVGVMIQIGTTATVVWDGDLSINALLLEILGGLAAMKFMWTQWPKFSRMSDK